MARKTDQGLDSFSLYFGSHYSVLLLDVSSEDRRCRLEAAARWQFCRHLFADRHNMGTLFSLKRLLEQWKTVVICLAGLAGMCGLAWVVCPLFMDKALVITGLPPLAGGIVATTIM